MTTSLPLETFFDHILDILNLGGERFQADNRAHWDAFFACAREERISFYLAEWLLTERGVMLPPDLVRGLGRYLQDNRMRNSLLRNQTVELAGRFREAGVPVMFLKGAAGLVRGLYPPAGRYISDIDILVRTRDLSASRGLLGEMGYRDSESGTIEKSPQHLRPMVHPRNAGSIELHTMPYADRLSGAPVMPRMWEDAFNCVTDGEPVTVPSIDDHVWILMRTDVVSRVYLPRPRDVIELFLIGDRGCDFDAGLLERRAREDLVPHIVSGMSYACRNYMGMEPFVPVNDSHLERWERWTLSFKRRIHATQLRHVEFRKEIPAARFLPESGAAQRLRYAACMFRYNFPKYLEKVSHLLGLKRCLR